MKKNKKRCSFKDCKKKLKLTDIECRCKKRFCIKHRLPELHNCEWNAKSKEEIEIYKKKCCLDRNAKFSKIEKI